MQEFEQETLVLEELSDDHLESVAGGGGGMEIEIVKTWGSPSG
jgi:hypothetical protein